MNTAMHAAHRTPRPFGDYLRHWRQHRRLSQLDLAHEADISTRHLSFVETGRSVPSREMVLRLAERLDIPLRERNALLVAAGYAPMYRERPLDDPALSAARAGGRTDPEKPRALPGTGGRPPLEPGRRPIACCRTCSTAPTPRCCARPSTCCACRCTRRDWPRTSPTCAQWRNHLFERLRQQIQATGDAGLAALLEELRAYPVPEGTDTHIEGEHLGVVMPFRFRTRFGELSFISTTTIFGTPVDVTLQELALETFFPADAATGEALRALARP